MDNPQELKDVPILLLVNFTIFDEIYKMENKSLFSPEARFFSKKKYLDLTEKYNYKRIIDFKTVFIQTDPLKALTDTTDLNLALALEGYGMMLCTIHNYREVFNQI